MDINYKVAIRTYYYHEDCGIYWEESERIIPVPSNVNDVDGFLKYVLKVSKRKNVEDVELISYEEIE